MENTNTIKAPASNDSKIISFGLLVLFLVFGVLGGWMSYAPLASSSVAVGKVSAGLNKKTVQHFEGGIVENIYAKDGDKVKKGQVLLKLQDIQLKSQLDIFKAQYQDAIATYARLEAQKNKSPKIVFTSESTDEAAMNNQINIFNVTNKSINDEKEITRNRIVQLKNQISGLNSLYDTKLKRNASLSEEVAEWKVLYEQKLVDKLKIRELEREQNTINGDLAHTKSEIARLKEQINEAKTQQLLREKELRNSTLNQFVEVKSIISDLKSKTLALKHTISRTEILAPIDGTVVGLGLHTIGGVVAGGEQILEIVPSDSKLIVIAQVQITDIDKVHVGLLSDVMFSAFNMQNVNVIEGKVVHVSADTFIDEGTGSPYYEAKIEVTEKGMEQLKDYKFSLVAGMPAEVMINIGSRTPLSYFVKPFVTMLKRGFNEE